MKFYRGLVDVGKAPVRNQVKRGFRPMTLSPDGLRQVESKDAEGKPLPPVDPMSAAEVSVLRHLFGADAVTEIKEIGEKKNLSFAAERDRLEERYGAKRIEQIFGAPGVRAALPREIEIEDAYMAIEDRVAAAMRAGQVEDAPMEYTADEEPAQPVVEAA